MQQLMSADDIRALFHVEFPQIDDKFVIDSVTNMEATVRWTVDHADLRPGATVSGPTMFALADLGAYVAILAMIGPKALTVTTSANIDFMRKPPSDRDLVADVRILKLGRALAVTEAHLHAAGGTDVVARASLTYSIPPKG